LIKHCFEKHQLSYRHHNNLHLASAHLTNSLLLEFPASGAKLKF
jgi:hypothetical protein